MNLTNRLFRKFAQWNLIEWKYEYYNETEKGYVDWLEAEKAKLAAGIVEPPWVRSPSIPPWSGSWRQGRGFTWMTEIWHPFWSGLNEKQQRTVIKKYPPTENWSDFSDFDS